MQHDNKTRLQAANDELEAARWQLSQRTRRGLDTTAAQADVKGAEQLVAAVKKLGDSEIEDGKA